MRSILSILVITILVSVFYYFDTFYNVSDHVSDRLIQETRETDFRIKILAIDDESLEQMGQWPWPRDRLANVSKQLVDAGARAVFVDVLYSEEAGDTDEDRVWQDILQQYDNIYLPLTFHLAPRQRIGEYIEYDRLNRPIYELSKDQVGHINTLEDKDRVVRDVLLGIRDEESGEMIPAMSVRLANTLLPAARQIRWTEYDEWFMGDQIIGTGAFGEVGFAYASSPSESMFETFSIHRVLQGEIDLAYFEDAVVLIGPYTVGLHDMFQVPNSNSQMFGVEIHANMMQSLLDGKLHSPVSKELGILIIGLTVLLSFLIIERIGAKWAIVPIVILVVASFVLTSFIYEGLRIIIPIFHILIALSLVFMTTLVSQYVVERLEKNRVTTIFGRYVDEGVVTEILAAREEVKLGGERKDVSLLFIDIRGFTSLSENMEPEEVVHVLNEYLDLCSQCIFAHEGTIDKFMGDGIMVIFGAPIPQENHAERAVRAALMIRSRSEELTKRLLEKHGRLVDFGMGVNSGFAVVGNIGSTKRLDYTAIGDTVNLAARLEANAAPGQILISEETYGRVAGMFEISPLDPIQVKGKQDLVEIYQVESEGQEEK